MANDAHTFGGKWTERKLAILQEYLRSYSTALSKSRLQRAYIDAFAGTGFRESRVDANQRRASQRKIETGASQRPLLNMNDSIETHRFLDGSARIALQCQPSFHSYIFIEKSRTRCQQLEGLRDQFPDLAPRMSIKRGDANKEIQALCAKRWSRHRAVLFLDPYGTEVQWKTIEAIAKTEAIDLWVLFPVGAVHRMLTQSGQIPQKWRHCLDELLGTSQWEDRFYQIEASLTLFGDKTERAVKAQTEVICEFFLERLREHFPAVAPKPALLRNSKNVPLYLFCFAAGNRKGAPIALRIASHILEMGS